MTEFLEMGGYGGYVWGSVGVFVLVLLVDALAPLLRRRQLVARLRGQWRRQQARKAAP